MNELVGANCGSASGAVISGEGMVGSASGFLSAGVPTVLATLWPVRDSDALAFTRRFYGELADGRTAAVASSGGLELLDPTSGARAPRVTDAVRAPQWLLRDR